MNPLGIILSVRDFPIVWKWLDRIPIDKLIVKYYPHGKAHNIAQDYFLAHGEYTHHIVLNEDTITTPSHVALLMDDVETKGFDVIGGYAFPVSMRRADVNLTSKDLSKIAVYSAEQYKFNTLYQTIRWNLDNPFRQVFFNGLTLTSISRRILKRIRIKPYRMRTDTTLGLRLHRGQMYDLQFSKDLKALNIPLWVDLRLLVIHFSDSTRYIDLHGKTPHVKLVKASGETETLRTDNPYPKRTKIKTSPTRGKIDRERFERVFLGRKKRES